MVERHKNAFIQQERPHQFLEALPDISPILPLECLRRRVGQALGKLVLLNGSCEAVLPQEAQQGRIVKFVQSGQHLSISAQLAEGGQDPLLPAVFIARHIQHQKSDQSPQLPNIMGLLHIGAQIWNDLSLEQLQIFRPAACLKSVFQPCC